MRLCLLLLCAGALFAQIRTLPARPQIICPGCTTITITGGNSQSGGPGSILKSPLSVKVTNTSTGIPVGQGLEIIFEVVASPTNSSGGGVSIDGINFFLGVEAFTAADGTASVQAELGDMPGQYQIQASCLGCVSPIFNENAIGCTASVRIATGGIFNSNMFGFFFSAFWCYSCRFRWNMWLQSLRVAADNYRSSLSKHVFAKQSILDPAHQLLSGWSGLAGVGAVIRGRCWTDQ